MPALDVGLDKTAFGLVPLQTFERHVMVATFPTRMIMTVLEPLAVARTRFVTYTLSNLAADEASRAAIEQGRDFVARGAAEDRDVACSAQRGLAARANDVFTFGLFEGAIRHFHRNLQSLIGDTDLEKMDDRSTVDG